MIYWRTSWPNQHWCFRCRLLGGRNWLNYTELSTFVRLSIESGFFVDLWGRVSGLLQSDVPFFHAVSDADAFHCNPGLSLFSMVSLLELNRFSSNVIPDATPLSCFGRRLTLLIHKDLDLVVGFEAFRVWRTGYSQTTIQEYSTAASGDTSGAVSGASVRTDIREYHQGAGKTGLG